VERCFDPHSPANGKTYTRFPYPVKLEMKTGTQENPRARQITRLPDR